MVNQDLLGLISHQKKNKKIASAFLKSVMGTILGSVGLFWFAPPANPAPYTLYPLDLIRGWKGHDPCDWDNQKSYL